MLEGSAALRSGCLPSCHQWQEVVVLVRQEGHCAPVHPMADLEVHQVHPAGKLEGAHPEEEVRRPG